MVNSAFSISYIENHIRCNFKELLLLKKKRKRSKALTGMAAELVKVGTLSTGSESNQPSPST